MKVAYVTMQFPVPSEAFAAVEMRALRRQGAKLSVLCYRPAPPGAAEMLQDRGLADMSVDHGSTEATLEGLLLAILRPVDSIFLCRMILLHCRRRPGQLLKALLLVPRTLVLHQRIKSLQPDALHLYWGHYPSLLGLLVRRTLPEILVSLFLGAYDLEEAFPLSGVMARQGDYLVTLSRANVPAIAALGAAPEEVRISFHGVDIPNPLPEPKKTPGLMVAAERLVPQKRTDDVLRVFAAVHQQFQEARLLVCGNGPERAHLERLAGELGIDDSIRFAGHLAHSEVLALLENAEIAITMSQSPSERLPNVMKEAMLRRCVCLSSRTAGIEELIDDGQTGLIVEPGDIDAAVARLRTLFQDPQAMVEIGNRAQARIVSDFDVDRLMAERLQQWSERLQRKRLRSRP